MKFLLLRPIQPPPPPPSRGFLRLYSWTIHRGRQSEVLKIFSANSNVVSFYLSLSLSFSLFFFFIFVSIRKMILTCRHWYIVLLFRRSLGRFWFPLGKFSWSIIKRKKLDSFHWKISSMGKNRWEIFCWRRSDEIWKKSSIFISCFK